MDNVSIGSIFLSMATIPTTDLHPILAEEIGQILANRKIRDKGAYLARLLRNQELALHDAEPIARMIRPLADALGIEIAANRTARSSARHASRNRKKSEYAFLVCVIQQLELWVGGSTEGMLEQNQQVMEIATEADDWATVAWAIGNQAHIVLERGKVEDALALQQKGLAIAREKRLPKAQWVNHLNAIAELLYERFRQPEQALTISDEVFALLADGQFPPTALWLSFHTRGRIVFNMGKFEEGMRLWAAAQSIGFDSGQTALGIRSANDIITQLFIKEEYTVALEYARSIGTSLSSGFASGTTVQLLLIIVRMLLKLNELPTAREKLLQTLQHAKAIETPLLRLQIHMALARLYLAEGDAIAGEHEATEAIAIAKHHRLPLPYRSTAVVLLGETYQAQGRLEEAEQAYQQALPSVASPATIHRLLAELYEASGNSDAAIGHYLKTVETGGGENRMIASQQLAKIFKSQGDFQQALQYYQRYHELCRHADQERSNNRMMMLRVQYRIDQLEEQSLRERQQKEQAHTTLHATETDLNAMRIALIEHQHQVRALRTRLQAIMGTIEQEKNVAALGKLRSLAREVGDTAGGNRAQWQARLRSSNKEFHHRLLAQHPTLPPALALLCDCIHSGMTANAILSVLHISPDALHKRRHRLRKALGLRPNQQLDSYLQRL